MFYDPTFILVLPALLLALYAQVKVKSTFARYLQERSYVGLTGAQVARQILNANGLHNVSVERVGESSRITTIPVRKRCAFRPRSTTAPVWLRWVWPRTKWAMRCSMLGAMCPGAEDQPVSGGGGGLPDGLSPVHVGLSVQHGCSDAGGDLVFIAALAFQLITLPVEFNASRRALAALQSGGYLTQAEVPKAKAVLSAAALTYVAAVAVAASQLIRLLFLRGQRRR